ncbi:hypothetical protein AGABI2DRAFT_196390 [Agaricus bisporus var. bisporus H97]|uniref:hypothetical protein n=1 Tax=Agaricus bisporus var. bisporus (strain H97 / ATCC MYA-4626 / FGSC 10389) TaxID=936046 RepID=UPI00029F5D04|nr:hypothetical protein AGABI2DRAFT_196390 [Agaricus bisporus var. bisporus H97]EKV50856.1 hypothetical protein AGABI2DRAFT_196390 [Agaricus bisporus var. bisporus H97]
MPRTHAQSSKHYSRPSVALAADDLGVLREGNETDEDILRRQLIELSRENDKLQTQVQLLHAQLAQRPPVEKIQELEKEYKNLDLLLQGTQRENERCMSELERAKQREKMLEQALSKLAGENWQASLDIPPPSLAARPGHRRINSVTSLASSPLSIASPAASRPASATPPPSSSQMSQPDRQQALAYIEQVRLLVLGMEQRLQTRENKLVKTLERAEGEGKRFEQYRKEISAGTD